MIGLIDGFQTAFSFLGTDPKAGGNDQPEYLTPEGIIVELTNARDDRYAPVGRGLALAVSHEFPRALSLMRDGKWYSDLSILFYTLMPM